ncbi:hypothetical protein HZB02_02865 [Candidatus Woesearchaeota archaeon]|nr:hypothetical protein [Candidatus Woesearchaeota archaeon]
MGLDFRVQKHNSWDVSGIVMRNGIYRFSVSDKLLPANTLEGLAEEAKKHPDKHRACDGPEFYALSAALCDNQYDPNVKSLYQFLSEATAQSQPYLNLLSNVLYFVDPARSQRVIKILHQYGLPTQHHLDGYFFDGPSGSIMDPATKADAYMQALFNTTDSLERINKVLKHLTGENGYASCFDGIRPHARERPLLVGVVAHLGCYVGVGDIHGSIVEHPSLSVIVEKIAELPKL